MGKESYTYDWFTKNAAEWPQILAPYTGLPDLSFLEIGSFEGMSACWLLHNILTEPSSRLTCIDLFPDSLGGDSELMPRASAPNATFDANVDAIGATDRVIKLRGSSEDILRRLPPGHYDFIYIDGSHNAAYVLSDTVLSWYLLKVGGLLCFDDYQWAPYLPPLERPQAGIDVFMQLYAGLYDVVNIGSQVTLRKTAKLPPQS
jgi:predicted O-methyltransferase YrrM